MHLHDHLVSNAAVVIAVVVYCPPFTRLAKRRNGDESVLLLGFLAAVTCGRLKSLSSFFCDFLEFLQVLQVVLVDLRSPF